MVGADECLRKGCAIRDLLKLPEAINPLIPFRIAFLPNYVSDEVENDEMSGKFHDSQQSRSIL